MPIVSSDALGRPKLWQSPLSLLLPEKAAAQVFPGKFRQAIREAGIEPLFIAADAKAWWGEWNVDVEPVGNGQAALKYLAPYVYRVAISNSRIQSVSETHVRYSYTPSGTKTPVSREVDGHEFVRGFLQHTLPSNMQRIRYYGFLAQNHKLSLDWVRMLVWFYLGWCYQLAHQPQAEPPLKPPLRCGDCGGDLLLVAITNGSGTVLWEHALAYLDSG